MLTVEKIRSELIDKILAIRNKEFLIALDNLISSSSAGGEIVKLTSEQIEILQMSEADIKKATWFPKRQWIKETLNG